MGKIERAGEKARKRRPPRRNAGTKAVRRAVPRAAGELFACFRHKKTAPEGAAFCGRHSVGSTLFFPSSTVKTEATSFLA